MQSIKDILNQCGGTMKVANALGLSQITIEGWKRTGIPPRHLFELQRKFSVEAELIEKINNASKRTK